MTWYKKMWWRFAIQAGRGYSCNSTRVCDGHGTWVPVFGTRLFFLTKRY